MCCDSLIHYFQYLGLRIFAAKKIPIEHILASSRNHSGRAGNGGNRAEGSQQQGVDLEEDASRKDACNC